jgi:hypothetical protein
MNNKRKKKRLSWKEHREHFLKDLRASEVLESIHKGVRDMERGQITQSLAKYRRQQQEAVEGFQVPGTT